MLLIQAPLSSLRVDETRTKLKNWYLLRGVFFYLSRELESDLRHYVIPRLLVERVSLMAEMK